MNDGKWTFYDSWLAFPHNRELERNSNVVGEFMVSLDSPGGGTYGEFAIRFHQFSDGKPAARLEVFDDAWAALARSGLVDAFAALDNAAPPDEVRRLLLERGFHDKTESLGRGGPTTCPTCNGSGYIVEDR